MLRFPYPVCKANGIPLYNSSFDKFYKTLYEPKIQSLDRDSKLVENGTADEIVTKTHGIIVFGLSGSQDMSVVRTGIVR